jgi:hypothetical protein
LGVQAPQAALAVAKDEIETLHRRLDTERSRARAAQERAVEDAAALRLSLEGAIERLSAQVSRQAPDESVAAIRSENEAMAALVPSGLEIPVLSQQLLEHPSVPAAPVIRTGSVQAGVRAYETKNYVRAYDVWQPLAEAGKASA